jgi:carboxypeptidase Q
MVAPPSLRPPRTARARRSVAVALALCGVGGILLGGGVCLAQAPAGDNALSVEAAATAAHLRDEALRGNRAFEIVRLLTVEAGPRLAGSAGDRAAVAWGVRTLGALGFSNVRAEPVTVPHWERGTIAGEIVTPYPQPVVLAALGGSVATPAEGITAEVVRAATVAELEALDPARVKGKIVFLDTPTERTRDGSGYGRAVGSRGTGPAVAGRLGAVAVLIRSIATGTDRFPHTGGTRYQEGVPEIPAAALAVPDADLLAAQLETGKPVTFRLQLLSRRHPDAQSANVIGEVPGRERPEEVVLLSCHLDSWDLGPSALDDAAGCGIVIEAARRINELPQKPRRTIRVVLYANEEFGLSGARAYAEKHAADLPRHVLAGESDLGAGKIWGVAYRIDAGRLPAFAAIAQLLAPLGIQDSGNTARGGADLIPLAPARVPVVDLQQDASLYFDVHHTANDTLDKIDPKELDQNVAAWVALAYAAAEMPGDFGRAPVPEPR